MSSRSVPFKLALIVASALSGASLTDSTFTLIVLSLVLVSMPPKFVPPLSCTRNVKPLPSGRPDLFAAGARTSWLLSSCVLETVI